MKKFKKTAKYVYLGFSDFDVSILLDPNRRGIFKLDSSSGYMSHYSLTDTTEGIFCKFSNELLLTAEEAEMIQNVMCLGGLNAVADYLKFIGFH